MSRATKKRARKRSPVRCDAPENTAEPEPVPVPTQERKGGEADRMDADWELHLSAMTPLWISSGDSVGLKDIPNEESIRVSCNDLTTRQRARLLLSSLLLPSHTTTSEFYSSHWGKRPLLATFDGDYEEEKDLYSKHVSRLHGFLDRQIIDEMIRTNKLRYGSDLNVTRYDRLEPHKPRCRITLDPPPEPPRTQDEEPQHVVVDPTQLWSLIDSSRCTLRLLRPHQHNHRIRSLLSLLELEFGCAVGSNAYLTPRNSQGFAPHYDDVDVFVLQLEGFKRWRVYSPNSIGETLPRCSSRDFTDEEVKEMGEEEVDMVLGPGDVMYLPRGWIHHAETVSRPVGVPAKYGLSDDHSLHLTVSAMQNWSWADFLEILMPVALEGAVASTKSISLREGLPVNFLSYMGTMHRLEDDESDLPEGLKQMAEAHAGESGEGDVNGADDPGERARIRELQHSFGEEAKKRIMRVCKHAMSMLDDVSDQIGIRFLSDRTPPSLLRPEESLTKEGRSSSTEPLHNREATKKIWPNTLCRIVRPDIARLVIEDSKAVLYHCLDNSMAYQQTPLSPMEFEVDDAPALEQLLTTVEPRWIMVQDLIHGDVEDKMEIAQALYDEGILATMIIGDADRSVQTG